MAESRYVQVYERRNSKRLSCRRLKQIARNIVISVTTVGNPDYLPVDVFLRLLPLGYQFLNQKLDHFRRRTFHLYAFTGNIVCNLYKLDVNDDGHVLHSWA